MKAFYDSLSRIKIIFVLTAAGLLAVSILSFIRIKSLSDTAKVVNHTNIVKLELERSISFLKDAETGQRGYLLTHDTTFLHPYYLALGNINECLRTLDELTKDNPLQVQNMRKLHMLADTRLTYLTSMIDQSYKTPVTMPQLQYGKLLMDSARRHVDLMIAEENRTLKVRTKALENASFITPFVIVLLILFSLAVLIISYTIITAELGRSSNLQQQITSRNKLIETILDSSVDHIAAFDKDLNYLLLNKQIEEVLGMKKEYAIGKKISDLVPEVTQTPAYQDMLTALKGNMLHVPQYHAVITKKYYENFYIPLKNPDESVYGLLMISHDITSITEAAENLKRANDSLRERNLLIETLIDSSTDFIAGFDKDLNITIWNKKATEILRIKTEDAIGKKVPEILPVAADSVNYRNIKNALNGQATLHQLNQLTAINRWFENSIVPLKSNNEVTGVLYYGHDMTEIMRGKEKLDEANTQLQHTNEELKRSEHRYLKMVADVEDYAIIFLSTAGIIENWNKGAEKINGYKEEEIVGKHFSMFYTDKDLQNHVPEKLITEATAHGHATHEGWRVKKDGSKFYCNVAITSLYDDNNILFGFSKLTRDLTERKLAEDQIKENAKNLEIKNKELEKMNAELSSFAYVSSHDLQEPLRKIQTFATRIIENELENLSESGKDYFERMRSAANRMQNLIKDLLAYSRTNSAERIFRMTDLNQLVDEVKNDLKEAIQEKAAVIEARNLCEAFIIPFQFRQLMQNLISNSLKFAKPGKPPHIIIKDEIVLGSSLRDRITDPEKTYCHISFTDNGIGFDPKFRYRIFEVFQRLHGIEKYQGTGIGLAICKKIVENHHGIISATSEPDNGATFDIYIPAEQTL